MMDKGDCYDRALRTIFCNEVCRGMWEDAEKVFKDRTRIWNPCEHCPFEVEEGESDDSLHD